MVNVLKNNNIIATVRNWNDALKVCASEVKSGTSQNHLQIIGNRGNILPVTIKHLI